MLSLLLRLGASAATMEVGGLIARKRRSVINKTIAGILIGTGIVFGLVALFIWLTFKYPPLNVALAFSFLFVAAGAVALTFQGYTERRENRRREVHSNGSLLPLIVAAAAASPLLARPNLVASLIPVALGLWAITRSPSSEEDDT